jgi:hypothetical protein
LGNDERCGTWSVVAARGSRLHDAPGVVEALSS